MTEPVAVEIETPNPDPALMRLDTGELDTAKLAGPGNANVWQDVLGPATSVEFDTGGTTPAMNSLDVGTLTVVTPNMPANQFRPFQPARVTQPTDQLDVALVMDSENTITTGFDTYDSLDPALFFKMEGYVNAPPYTIVSPTLTDLNTVHAWTGTPGRSHSTKTVNGVLECTNLIKNPSWENGTTYNDFWGYYPFGDGMVSTYFAGSGEHPTEGLTTLTFGGTSPASPAAYAYGYVGTYHADPDAGYLNPVTGGTVYTSHSECYFIGTGAGNLTQRIVWFGAGGAGLGYVDGTAVPVTTGNRYRPTVTATAPAGATHCQVISWLVALEPSKVYQVWHDMTMLYTGSEPHEPFSGDTPASEIGVNVNFNGDPIDTLSLQTRIPSLSDLDELHAVPVDPDTTITVSFTIKNQSPSTTYTVGYNGGIWPLEWSVPDLVGYSLAPGKVLTVTHSGNPINEPRIGYVQLDGAATNIDVTQTITYTVGGVPRYLWSGAVGDLTTTYRKEDNQSISVIGGSDAVQIVSNTEIPADADTTVGDTFNLRAAMLADLSPVPLEIRDEYRSGTKAFGANWFNVGNPITNVTVADPAAGTVTPDGQLVGTKRYATHTGTATTPGQEQGLETYVGGLTPGTRYRVTVRAQLGPEWDSTTGDRANYYWLGTLEEGLGTRWKIANSNSGAVTTMYHTFTALQSYHTIQLVLHENLTRTGNGVWESVIFGDGFISDLSTDPYTLGDNKHAAPLSEHLNILCDSVGGLWRVGGSDGGLKLHRFITPEIRARFSDVAEPSYTDLQIEYRTDLVVNVLAMKNLGVAAGEGTETEYTFTNDESVARWGSRRREVTVNLEYPDQVALRAAEILAERAEPQNIPTELTYLFSAVEGGTINVHEAIEVTRAGETYTCLVVGVAHRLSKRPGHTAPAHHVTLTLRKV